MSNLNSALISIFISGVLMTMGVFLCFREDWYSWIGITSFLLSGVFFAVMDHFVDELEEERNAEILEVKEPYRQGPNTPLRPNPRHKRK